MSVYNCQLTQALFSEIKNIVVVESIKEIVTVLPFDSRRDRQDQTFNTCHGLIRTKHFKAPFNVTAIWSKIVDKLSVSNIHYLFFMRLIPCPSLYHTETRAITKTNVRMKI